MNNTKIGKTLKSQLSITFIIIIVIAFSSCLLFNTFFLKSFYQRQKTKNLKSTYEELCDGIKNNISDDDFMYIIGRCSRKFNLDILVIDSDTNVVRASMKDYEPIKRQLVDDILYKITNNTKYSVVEVANNYTIGIKNDPFINMEFIEMWGYIDEDNIFIIRSAIESISRAARLSNIFLVYVGITAIIISSIFIILFSRRITRPIQELTNISSQMSKLQFDAKYEGHSGNEIDFLGENINFLSQTLETTISELRTANNELRRDVETKEKIDARRQEFISNISHELKTPIALIQGYAEGLKEGMGDDPETRDYYVDVIVDEAVRMNDMVKKLLTLNEIEVGRDNVLIERFCISSLIDNILKSMDIVFKNNNIQLSNTIPDDCFVWGDQYRTEEIIRNYLSNALHHCKEIDGQKLIQIQSVNLGEKTKITVYNTGDKIPDEAIDMLWDKFYKIDKARTREYGGSGIGLSIVKAAVECMGASCGVENKENGVEFWFELNIV